MGSTAGLEHLPFPVAALDAVATVGWSNAAWAEMAAARGDAGAAGDLAAACGFGPRIDDHLRELIDRAAGGAVGGSVDLDVPHLGLLRWARLHVSPREPGRAAGALLSIVPLRHLPDPETVGIVPDYDEFIETYEHLSHGMILLDESLRIRIATGSAANFLGRPGVAYEGGSAFDHVHPGDHRARHRRGRRGALPSR